MNKFLSLAQKIVSIKDSISYEKFKDENTNQSLKILNGSDSYDDILDYDTDIVVAAITGSAGLLPVFWCCRKRNNNSTSQ